MTSEYIYESWIRLPVGLIADARFTQTAKILCAVLIDRTKDNERCEIRISINKLAQACGSSERAINKALNELEDWGYIKRKRTGRTTIYTVNDCILPPTERRYKHEENNNEQRSKGQMEF